MSVSKRSSSAITASQAGVSTPTTLRPSASGRERRMRMQKLDSLLCPRTASTGEGQAPPSESEPVICECCGDAGFVRRELPLGHPDFGRAWPCEACNPVPVAWGIPDRLALATFDAFDLALNPGMRAAKEACQAVAAGERWCALLQIGRA